MTFCESWIKTTFLRYETESTKDKKEGWTEFHKIRNTATNIHSAIKYILDLFYLNVWLLCYQACLSTLCVPDVHKD